MKTSKLTAKPELIAMMLLAFLTLTVAQSRAQGLSQSLAPTWEGGADGSSHSITFEVRNSGASVIQITSIAYPFPVFSPGGNDQDSPSFPQDFALEGGLPVSVAAGQYQSLTFDFTTFLDIDPDLEVTTSTYQANLSYSENGVPQQPIAIILKFSIADVPEPGTVNLLASGVIGGLAYAWRRRAKA